MSTMRRENQAKRVMPKPKRRREAILFALDVIFFIAALVPSMPVVIRWSLWFTCWTMTVILVQIHFERPLELKRRIRLTLGLILLFFISFQSLARNQWHEEKADAISGKLFVPNPIKNPLRIFEVGNSGTVFNFTNKDPNAEAIKFLWDAGFRIEAENGIEVTTSVKGP